MPEGVLKFGNHDSQADLTVGLYDQRLF